MVYPGYGNGTGHSYSESPNIYAEIYHKYYPDAVNHVTTRINQSPRNLYLYTQPHAYAPAMAHSTPQKTEPRPSGRSNQPVIPIYHDQYSQSLKFFHGAE